MKLTIKAKSINGIPALQKLYYDSQHIDKTTLTRNERIATETVIVKVISEEPYVLEINFKKIFLLPRINRIANDYNNKMIGQTITQLLKMVNGYNTIEMEYDIK